MKIPKLSYDGQGVILADKKNVVARLEGDGHELADLFVNAPKMLTALEEAHGVIYEALNRRGGKLALSHALIDICNVLAKAKGVALT